jgi:cytochrome c oxidase cbb3-type subunit III
MKASQAVNSNNREDYSPLVAAGLALALVMLLVLGAYWMSDGLRLETAAAALLEERVHRGESLYAEQCAGCHGINGEGGTAPALKDRMVLKNTPDQVFFSVIRSGVPNTQMPSWSVDFGGPLTDEEIRDLVALMRSWEPDAPEILPAGSQPDAEQGALLFSSTCAICHGEDGKGGNPGIPAINDPERLSKFNDDWYRSVIANGRPAKGMPTWGTVLSPAQINDLVKLISAWREGQVVNPSYSLSNLLELAGFALSQSDESSARLHLGRALEIAGDPTAAGIYKVIAQMDSGDMNAAAEELAELVEGGPPGDSTAGANLYAVHCAACHGEQGEGGLGNPLLENEFVRAETNPVLAALIKEGRPGTLMAGFGDRLSEQEIADLIAWLRER